MHNLQEWKDGAETDLKLELKQYYNEVEYKLTNRMILEIKEFAKFKKEIHARLHTCHVRPHIHQAQARTRRAPSG
jgi:hypothetical protein